MWCPKVAELLLEEKQSEEGRQESREGGGDREGRKKEKSRGIS
jgi:hypothetical protein